MLISALQLFFYKPNLWWPNGMGEQSLYNVEITVHVDGFGESDEWSHHFGFRKIQSEIDSATGGRYNLELSKWSGWIIGQNGFRVCLF